MDTYYASPERVDPKLLSAQIWKVKEDALVSGLMVTIGGLLAVVNDHRQVVALNDTFLEVLGVRDPEGCLGLRPGEALECVHAHEMEGGCGTARSCVTCGAAVAMVTSLASGMNEERICALSAPGKFGNKDLSFLVKSRPITVQGERFLLLVLQDITMQERRAALERTFFHDVNNVLQTLLSASELLLLERPDSLTRHVADASRRLHREVDIQRKLLSGFVGGYEVSSEPLNIQYMFDELARFFEGHPAIRRQTIQFEGAGGVKPIITDSVLLLRVLSNMILNALEAGREGDLVRVWCKAVDQTTTFHVHNSAHIPPSVQERIFQRYFSTKGGAGRGVGTYSMKLFGEEVLGGTVSFESSVMDGTTFSLVLPNRPNDR